MVLEMAAHLTKLPPNVSNFILWSFQGSKTPEPTVAAAPPQAAPEGQFRDK